MTARRVSRKTHQQVLMEAWWVRALLALAFILLAYGIASLAIDSGSLLEYAAAIISIWYAVHNGIRAFRLAVFS
jgi:type VI protein secretion system component VasF